MNDRFSLSSLTALPEAERRRRLEELELELSAGLASAKTPAAFLQQGQALVAQLRALGHNLWSFDADDDFELWCGDWSRDDGGPLTLEFRFPCVAKARWRPRRFHLTAEAGRIKATGQRVGFVVEGDPNAPEGRRLDSHPATGGQVLSRTHPDGRFEVRLDGTLAAGRSDEAHAMKVLIGALQSAGHSVTVLEEAHDHRGEDSRLELDGRNVPVQIVSVPSDPTLWRTIAKVGTHAESGTIDACEMVRHSFEKKRGKAHGTLLVLNAAHLGAVVGPSLVRSYLARYEQPRIEFGIVEAWLVGPTVRSTVSFE